MPLHPLVKQAALMFETKQKVVANLSAISNDIPPGKYLFAIYQWRFHGIKEDLLLKPIASNALLTEHLNSLLEQATESREDITISLDDPAWGELDSHHYNLWNEAESAKKESGIGLSTGKKVYQRATEQELLYSKINYQAQRILRFKG